MRMSAHAVVQEFINQRATYGRIQRLRLPAANSSRLINELSSSTRPHSLTACRPAVPYGCHASRLPVMSAAVPRAG
jgi:hypothetical protein